MNASPQPQSAEETDSHSELPQQALYESQKRQVVGALAGGVAHDFNNILTAVICRLELALTDEKVPDDTRDLLKQALESAQRGAELNTKLLAFSRQANRKSAPVNLGQLINEVVFILRRSIDPRIQVQCFPPPAGLWPVMGDAGQLTQLLMNLCLNARDAMTEGGQLSLVCSNQTVGRDAKFPLRRAGEFVQVTVSDTGRGMPPEVLARLFEPYFTTKAFGKGAGLGLSIANHVVVEHGGWMEVESEQGWGSRFHCFLPRTNATATPTRSASNEGMSGKALEGKETVLLVDDEDSIRTVVRAILSYRGYEVLEASDGEEALRKFKKSPGEIDLILLDLQMPRMNGWDTLDEILKLKSDARVVLLSGGNAERFGERNAKPRPQKLLSKPFESAELLKMVREVLDEPAVTK
jgi:two-component system cell cycle sensor histidine kinase/response regulator CckA